MRSKPLIDGLFAKTRREVLAATVMRPRKWWYLADLARHIGVRPSSLQREMESLVAAGILRRRREGRQVYYRPDEACPIMPELQGIVAKTAGLADLLRGYLAPFGKCIEAAFVFGSMARMEAMSDSDVDLMIVGTVKLADLASVIHDAEDRLGRDVNPVLFSPGEFAKKSAEQHHFVKTVLGSDKLFLIGSCDDLARIARLQSGKDASNEQTRN